MSIFNGLKGCIDKNNIRYWFFVNIYMLVVIIDLIKWIVGFEYLYWCLIIINM